MHSPSVHPSIGSREAEIITKQFRYVGIAATHDGQRIYAIASDATVKLFSGTSLEQEWPIENGFIPSAITLSKSERLLYVGMTHGIIRIYGIPLVFDAFIDLSAHGSSIRRLLVSDDEQYLFSIAESAYVLLFRQSTHVIESIASVEDFSRSFVEQREQRRVRPFEYILVTRTEFEEKKRRVKDIQGRIE